LLLIQIESKIIKKISIKENNELFIRQLINEKVNMETKGKKENQLINNKIKERKIKIYHASTDVCCSKHI
jgi:hypothetical protein